MVNMRKTTNISSLVCGSRRGSRNEDPELFAVVWVVLTEVKSVPVLAKVKLWAPIVMLLVCDMERFFCCMEKEDVTVEVPLHATLFVHMIDVEEALAQVMPGIF